MADQPKSKSNKRLLPTLITSLAATAITIYANPAQTQTSSDFPLASCAGWNGTLLSKSGIGTAKAEILGVVTKANIQEYCERIHDNGDDKTLAGRVAKCMRETVPEHAGETISATANCTKGEMRFVNARGKSTRAKFPLQPDSDQSCASGMPPLIAQYAIMCPQPPGPQRSRTANSRLPLEDGTYVTEPSLCRLTADQITEKLGDETGMRVRQINGNKLTDGYEMSCTIRAVSIRDQNVRFQATCSSEGERARINGAWTIIDAKTFRIGSRTFSACGRSIWPFN